MLVNITHKGLLGETPIKFFAHPKEIKANVYEAKVSKIVANRLNKILEEKSKQLNIKCDEKIAISIDRQNAVVYHSNDRGMNGIIIVTYA